jgi:hypothetical protein
MAKKDHREIIAPYKCVQSLERFNEVLVGYRQAFEFMLKYVKETDCGNKPYQDHVINNAEQKQELLNEFYNS